MDLHSVLNDFSNSWKNDNNSVDFGINYSSNYGNKSSSSHSNNYGNNHGDNYNNNYDSYCRNNYKSNYKSNYSSDYINKSHCKSQQKRQDAVDGLLESRLACLTIGETGVVDVDSRSTAPDEPAPTSSPNTVQEAPTKSPEEPIWPEFGFSDEPKSQVSRDRFGHLMQSPSSSSDFESPDETSCTTPESDSDNEADSLEIRPTRLPDSDVFVKPKIPKELRLLVDDSEKDDVDEEDARMHSALRHTGSRQVKGDWTSILTSPSLRQPRRKSKKAKADGSLLACPYTKHDNATQEQLYRCRRMAFQDTHRLKEHLYRVHRQKPHCTRCGEIFASKADLEPHSRLQEVCNLAEAIHIEGFTSTQEDELKSKKRKRNLKTEEDKWANIFRILFPTCPKMPDPYYRITSDDHPKGFTMDQSDVESIFADDVPSELEERTFSRLEAISGGLDDEQRREVKSIFKDFTSERVRQITERTDSVSENAETTEPRGVPSPEKSLHKNAVSDETFIAIADPIGLEGRILSVLEPEPVHEDVPSQQGLPGAPPESENDMLEKALAAWNEAAVQGWDCGLTKGNGLNGLVGASHVTQSDVSNLLFDFNFIDDFQVAVDDNHPAFNPFGGFPSWQGAWNGSFAH
ncbi:hypothetical protein CGCS363_v011902 [Colletotrichum siamense]|uniref:uncharacterized protein n=1 Tax=Colletotrichum siamense TaxID=690259 RepID=UPI00187284E7|nr:uncharacterized protein CGCS363_v011902 [Colletotrichum siamense]KAF5489509.1 hypothetical protein CGCS363_v011902 [Colletotrichum siamense]